MEVYSSLELAVKQLSPDDKRRVYKVHNRFNTNPALQTQFVLATSAGQAAVAIVGESNIDVVSQKDKYNAALSALMQDAKK